MSMRDYDYWPFWLAADDASNFIDIDDYNFRGGIDPFSVKKVIFGEGAMWYAGHMAVCEFLGDLAKLYEERIEDMVWNPNRSRR